MRGDTVKLTTEMFKPIEKIISLLEKVGCNRNKY